jgi:quinol monooxygenase YgiN
LAGNPGANVEMRFPRCHSARECEHRGNSGHQSLRINGKRQSREGDPHKLVFFEIFSSSAAHKFHLEQDYMKRLFTALEGKLAGATIMTKLNAL